MMRKTAKIFILLFVLAAIVPSCTKKDTKLEFFQTACNNLKISNPDYSWLPDSVCEDGPNGASLSLSFDLDCDEACFNLIRMGNVQFFAGPNEVSPQTATKVKLKSDPQVTIAGERVTFTYCFNMSTQQEWEALTHIVMRWNIENEIQDWSNSLLLRINIPGRPVDPSTYNVVETVHVHDSIIQFKLWDHAAQDGDIVSVNLNDVWIIEHHYLLKAGTYFQANILPGDNKLIIFAENEGSSGPNTCSISINGGHEIQLSPDLLTGEAVNIVF